MFDVWRHRLDHYPMVPHPFGLGPSAFSSVRSGIFPWVPRLPLALPPVLPFAGMVNPYKGNNIRDYYTSLPFHWLKLNHMT
jgi:hypothetical protein